MKKAVLAAVLMACAAAYALAESFSGNLLIRPDWTHKKTGATIASESFGTIYNWTFTSGNSTNQMNQLWVSRRTLASNAVETINIAGGITNSFGTVLTMAKVRLIWIGANSTNAGPILVGGADANTFSTWAGDDSDKVRIRPGGGVMLIAPDATGFAVSTNGNLAVTNESAAAVSYDIYIGASD